MFLKVIQIITSIVTKIIFECSLFNSFVEIESDDDSHNQYTCQDCSKVFHNRNDLTIHSLSHSRKSEITFQRNHLFTLDFIEGGKYLNKLPNT